MIAGRDAPRGNSRLSIGRELKLMEEQAIPFLNEAVGFELLQTTRSASWPGIVIDEVQSPKADFELSSVHSYLIGLHLAGSCNVTQEIDGKVIRGVKVPVSLSIVPNDTVTHWSVDKPNRYAALWLPPELVRDTAREMFEGTQDNARLAPVFDAHDTIVERLGAILMQELRRAPHPAQHLIYEAASQAFTAHMLRAYTREIRPIPNATSQLSARAVRDVTDYIDENIQSKISLSELAAIAGSSRFHFYQAFPQHGRPKPNGISRAFASESGGDLASRRPIDDCADCFSGRFFGSEPLYTPLSHVDRGHSRTLSSRQQTCDG